MATKKTTTTDPEQLERLAQMIGDEIDGERERLIEQLKEKDGLKLSFRSGACHANMAGIRSSSTEGERMALINWSHAARRKLLERA